VVVALELVFAGMPIAPAITEARDDCVSAIDEQVGLEHGRRIEQRNDRTERGRLARRRRLHGGWSLPRWPLRGRLTGIGPHR
jgi:hypothetical protein